MGSDAFICPTCAAFAHQTWHRTELRPVRASAVHSPSEALFLLEQLTFNLQALAKQGATTYVTAASGLFVSQCDRCSALALWFDDRLLWPRTGTAPPPSAALPEDVKALYDEASIIAADSPRGAAALLRLAVETVCRRVVPNKDRLNDCVTELVARGVDTDTQKALDVVRIIGNRSVHTELQADSADNADTVAKLFGVVNRIAEALCPQPSETEQLYSALPSAERAKIDRRNEKAKRPTG